MLSVESARATIEARNEELRAVLHVLKKPLHDKSVTDGPLEGVPYVLKDVWDTEGIPTTGGSYRHRERVPSESSRVFVALQKTGAVLLGKSNLCDMAFSMESDNHIFGPVRNPFDASRTAGGSTGGGAAAVASGMAAFDWGTDFGGSIRLPAAFCGVVGMRLSAAMWPVEREHFPRLSPRFYSFCGMGPLTRDVGTARRVVEALAPALRVRDRGTATAAATGRVALWVPDKAHVGEWPTFEEDAGKALARAGVEVERAALPTPSEVHETFVAYLCSHFFDFIGSEEMTISEGLAATAFGVLSNGRVDKRLHPVSASLFALVGLGKLVRYRDPAPQEARVEALRATAQRVWEKGLIVSPTTTSLPPKHGRAVLALRAPSFAMFGNLVDATAIAIPFERFAGTGLPRSLQILGPPGSEDAVLSLAERLTVR